MYSHFSILMHVHVDTCACIYKYMYSDIMFTRASGLILLYFDFALLMSVIYCLL